MRHDNATHPRTPVSPASLLGLFGLFALSACTPATPLNLLSAPAKWLIQQDSDRLQAKAEPMTVERMLAQARKKAGADEDSHTTALNQTLTLDARGQSPTQLKELIVERLHLKPGSRSHIWLRFGLETEGASVATVQAAIDRARRVAALLERQSLAKVALTFDPQLTQGRVLIGVSPAPKGDNRV